MEKTAAERPAVVEKAQEKTEAKTKPRLTRKPRPSADTKAVDAKSADTKSDAEIAESPADADRAAMRSAARQGKDQGHTAVADAARAVRQRPSRRSLRPAAAGQPPVETAVAPDERRDANDLARAAIERLRANGETSPRAPEPARAHEAPKVANAPRIATLAALLPRPRPRFVRCRRRSWSRARRPANPLVRLRRRRGRLMRPMRRRPEPADAAGRYSALAPARSACRHGRAFRARARHGGRRGRAVDGEVDLPRGPAEIILAETNP